MNVVTELLGRRVKATVNPGWSHTAHGDATEVVEGIVRAVGLNDQGGFSLLIEDADGVLRTRVSSVTTIGTIP